MEWTMKVPLLMVLTTCAFPLVAHRAWPAPIFAAAACLCLVEFTQGPGRRGAPVWFWVLMFALYPVLGLALAPFMRP